MIQDIKDFIKKYKFAAKPLTYEQLQFRMSLLKEEFDETNAAFATGDAEELVDGHIDLIVIALGNLQLAGVNTQKAWNEVYRANMSKRRGIKTGRESSGGFDIVKPLDWIAPNHEDNHGNLPEIFETR